MTEMPSPAARWNPDAYRIARRKMVELQLKNAAFRIPAFWKS